MVVTGPAVPPMFECKPTWQICGEFAQALAKKLELDVTPEDVWPFKTDEDIINAMFQNEALPLGGYPALNYAEAIQHPEGYQLTQYHNQFDFIPYREDGDASKPFLFYTPSGKIEFKADWFAEKFNLPALPVHEEPTESPISTPELFEEYPLLAHTRVHPHWSFLHYNLIHDGGYASPLIREAFVDAKEPTVQMHPTAAAKYGLKEGDMVVVESKYGKLQGKLLFSKRLHPLIVHTPLYWSNCENRINPYEISLRKGIQLPQRGPLGEGKTSRHLTGQATHAGVLVKVYKA